MSSVSPIHQSGTRIRTLSSVRAILAAWPGLASVPITRRPWTCVALVLIGVACCAAVISVALLIARLGPVPKAQLQLQAWEAACVLLGSPVPATPEPLAGNGTLQGSVPGAGKYRAQRTLDTAETITAADLVLALGQPQWGCLDYGLLNQQATIWVRLVLDEGKIEAYAPLPATAARLSPDSPVHILYCFARAEDYPVSQVGPWHGFAALAAYQDCRIPSTAMP